MENKLYNPRYQLMIGLILNFSFLLVLYSCKISYSNAQLPSGQNLHNIWAGSDINDYVTSGINYMQYGVFGSGHNPDHLRTIGYPALIAFFYKLFGGHWVLALQIFQCILFAFLYPLVTKLAKEIVPGISNTVLSAIFIFSLISGTYFVRSVMILTDTMFAFFFLLGIWLGFKSVGRNKPGYLLGYLACITFAGLVRPTLFLFPLLNMALFFFVAKRYDLRLRSILTKGLLTTLLFVFTCNLPSIRNYINYSFLSPSSVVGLNAFQSVSQKILMQAGKETEYYALENEIKGAGSIAAMTQLRKNIMISSMRHYPTITVQMLIKNTINVFFDNHVLNNMGNYFGYNWKIYSASSSPFVSEYQYKRSTICFYGTYLLMAVYLVLWLALSYFIYCCFIDRRYEYMVIIGTLLTIFIFPAVIIGDGGSRLRLPFEPFLIIFSFYQLSQMQIARSIGLYTGALATSFVHWQGTEGLKLSRFFQKQESIKPKHIL